MDSRLENRRGNNDAKCASCGWWTGRANAAGQCDRHDIKTLDLAVCTEWRDNEPMQTILPPERDE